MPERYLTSAEVAKVFFGRNSLWLRRIVVEMQPWTIPSMPSGRRCYTLDDVEKIALWAAAARRINGIDAERVLKLTALVREGWETRHG